MKKSLPILCFIIFVPLMFLSACDIKTAQPLKSLTHPHIAQYECIEATFGDKDILDSYDYIKITLFDEETLSFSYKMKNDEPKSIESKYEFDDVTRTLTAQISLTGHDFKQSVVIDNGKFTISKSIGGKQLIMKFKAV